MAEWETKLQRREEFWRKKVAAMALDTRQAESAVKGLEETRAVDYRGSRAGPAPVNPSPNPKYSPEPSVIKPGLGSPPTLPPSHEGRARNLRMSREYEVVDTFGSGARRHEASSSPVRQSQVDISRVVGADELDQLRRQVHELQDELHSRARMASPSRVTGGFQAEFDNEELKNLQNKNAYLHAQQQKIQEFSQENVRIREAAQQSIAMLQRMIDDKNEQLERKDRVMDNLRQEMQIERQRA